MTASASVLLLPCFAVLAAIASVHPLRCREPDWLVVAVLHAVFVAQSRETGFEFGVAWFFVCQSAAAALLRRLVPSGFFLRPVITRLVYYLLSLFYCDDIHDSLRASTHKN